MSFIIDVFFEMLAMLLGLLGMVATFAGVLVTIFGALLMVDSVTTFLTDTLKLDVAALPSWFGWVLGVIVIIVGILMMSLSSVMRKRIGRVGR
ncbi:hypothetical protein ACFLWJ_00170 [Chloroflexota bacterium]